MDMDIKDVNINKQKEERESFYQTLKDNLRIEVEKAKERLKELPQESQKADNEVKTIQADIKKVGRPQKYIKDDTGKNVNKSRITFELDSKIIKALRFKKVAEGIILNNYIEQLLLDNIPKKYFDMIED